jgi:hypothetical protein
VLLDPAVDLEASALLQVDPVALRLVVAIRLRDLREHLLLAIKARPRDLVPLRLADRVDSIRNRTRRSRHCAKQSTIKRLLPS